jgi:hypothetical protein
MTLRNNIPFPEWPDVARRIRRAVEETGLNACVTCDDGRFQTVQMDNTTHDWNRVLSEREPLLRYLADFPISPLLGCLCLDSFEEEATQAFVQNELHEDQLDSCLCGRIFALVERNASCGGDFWRERYEDFRSDFARDRRVTVEIEVGTEMVATCFEASWAAPWERVREDPSPGSLKGLSRLLGLDLGLSWDDDDEDEDLDD